MNDTRTTPPSHTEFVKRFKIAIPDRSRVLRELRPGDRLRVVREPDNPHDGNAIQVDHERDKLGYVPRTDAAELAPQLDAGFCFVGIVAAIDPERGEIFADLYKRILLPLDGVTGFVLTEYCQSFPHPSASTRYTMSFRQRKLVCEEIEDEKDIRRSEFVFPVEKWPAILEAVNKCNFPAWDDEYDSKIHFDAVFWELTLRMSGGRTKHSRGNITHPEEWDLFRALLQECKDLSEFVRGNIRFRTLPWSEYYLKRHRNNEHRVFRQRG